MRKPTQYSRREMMEPGGQGRLSGSVGKCLDHGYILKLQLTEFPDRLDMGPQMKCKDWLPHLWPEQLEYWSAEDWP